MGKLVCRPATQEDSPFLCALMRETPMGEKIQIIQDRGDDFFSASKLQAKYPEVWGVFDEDTHHAVAVFSIGRRPVFLNGSTHQVRYLSDLRVRPEYRNGLLLARGFRTLRTNVFRPNEWAQTLILDDNVEAGRLLTSKRAGLPTYFPCGRYGTWFFHSQPLEQIPSRYFVRQSQPNDIPAMQALLENEGPSAAFTPIVNFKTLEEIDFRLAFLGNELIGLLGIWDTSRYRQTQISSYRGPIRWGRPFYNLWAQFRGSPFLPSTGSFLSVKSLTCILCRNRDPHILKALLASTLETKGLFGIGLDLTDPMAEALQKLRAHRTFASHYLVGFSGTPPKIEAPFYFDFARI